ncbi:MAG TPA: glycosyltransferase family 4 protein [Gemmata sp.]|nr:glycosyltransferase family 4 protein [Gemmata sp.]
MQVASFKRKRRTNGHDEYNGWTIVRSSGCYFGVPEHLDADLLHHRADFRSHPAILKATTRAALLALIDRHGNVPPLPTEVGRCEGYDLVRHGAVFYAIPHGEGVVDLDLEEDRQRAGVISGASAEEVRERLRIIREAVPVEFAGWLPIFKSMGNCGQHPQFTHTATPPAGYCFTRSIPIENRDTSRKGILSWVSNCFSFALLVLAWPRDRIYRVLCGLGVALRLVFAPFRNGPPVPLHARLRLLAAVIRLSVLLWRGGGRPLHILRFLRSRNYSSQVLLAGPRPLVFLTSAPFTYNQNPWVIEIEDPTTLFFPFVQNGHTTHTNVADSPYFPIVRSLLESDQCRAILTHMRSSARMLPNLFRSEAITRKIRYHPLGVKVPQRWQRHDDSDPQHINLLYINSWSQHPGNLQVRGGLDVLDAFAILHERYPQLRLTMRTSMIPLDDSYFQNIESNWVRVINRFMTAEEMEALHAESHIFLLPAARVHIVSLLQAMAAGLAVVASDGWGFTEYLTHERNGLIVEGRYGKTSWADEEAGMLREEYESTYSPDPKIVQGIVEAVSRLVEDHELRRRLGRTARHDVETTYNLDNWNRGLKEVFNSALNQ